MKTLNIFPNKENNKNNSNKKHNLKNIIIILILLSVFTIISAFSYVNAVSNNLSESVFRLHVIANSNSQEDQDLKYLVRDALIEYMNSICKDETNKEEAIRVANKHIDEFYEIANKVIKENGFDYSVKLEIGNFSFPTKKYGDISFPAGYYDALKVEIGTATGENWWCVMFPPLCFVDVTSGVVPDDSKESLKDSMPNEEYELLNVNDQDTADIKFKFKLIEYLENIKIKTAQN